MFRLFLTMVACTVFLLGCAQIPRQELNAYASAYEQAEMAGDQLLDVFAPYFPEDLTPDGEAKREEEDVCADLSIDEASGIRRCYDPILALGPEAGRVNEPVFGQIRRAALRVIGDYNRMLVGLASGQSADAVASRFDRGAGLVQSFASFDPTGQSTQVATILSLLQPLAQKLEGYRASNAAARSVVEAQPDVSKLIRAMIADTKVLYSLYGRKRIRQYDLLQLDRDDAVDDEDKEAVERIDSELAVIAAEGEAMEGALNAYVRLLDSSDAALLDLSENISAFQSDPAAATAAFIRTATEARLLSSEFIGQIRALQNARN